MDVFRIHPAVGIARVGNSEDFIIAPETMAGSPVSGSTLMGGLPIRAGTLSDPVRSSDLRDAHGALKRQAARFRIFMYSGLAGESWPRGDGSEVTIGAHVGGKIVKDIIWTVHVANKKANTFVLVEDGPYQAIVSYEEGRLPPIRNPSISDPNAKQPPDGEKLPVLNNPQRVRELTIDPGPRVISGKSTLGPRFDKNTVAAYYSVAQSRVVKLDHYPKSFPADTFPQMDAPSGPIDTLGELRTDAEGRLLVLGGYGRAAGWKIGGAMPPLPHDVNNNQWFDDTSDGPVSATLVFEDDSLTVAQGAWVTTTDPSFAPQIKNVVSCWDDIYDCWVRELGLAPDIFDRDRGGYQVSYKPTFDDQLAPIFHSSALQQWVVNLDTTGSSAHSAVALIKATDDPSTTILQGTVYFRDPNDQKQYSDLSLMPFHLGDVYQPLLALRKTQYFFLQRWAAGLGNFSPGDGPALGPGERLDKATFVNCLGGRFGPGIDLTFVMREAAIYFESANWRTSGAGPFRIHAKRLAYDAITSGDKPLLTCGYVPRHVEADGLEPGDLTKFLAIPWHTDYNSCATHLPNPNPKGNKTLFWSWPAQRPVAVYALADVKPGGKPGDPPQLGQQRWSVRGEGTDSTKPENWGRYQRPNNIHDILDHWHRIGIVVQAPAIVIDTTLSLHLDVDWYLEVESQLSDTGKTPVVPYPNFDSGG